VLKSQKTGRHCTGWCEDFDVRLAYLNAGHSPATHRGVPQGVLYRACPFPDGGAVVGANRATMGALKLSRLLVAR